MSSINFSVKPNPFKEPMGNLMGFCDLIIDDILIVSGFKISRNSKTGDLFVSNPSQPSKKTDDQGKVIYYDTARFIDPKAEDEKQTPWQKEVYGVMLDEFRKAQSGGGTPAPSRQTTPPPKTEKTPATTPATSKGSAVTARSNPLWG